MKELHGDVTSSRRRVKEGGWGQEEDLWLSIPGLPLSSCVMLDRHLTSLSLPQQSGRDHNTLL